MKILLNDIYISQINIEVVHESIILPETIIKNSNNNWEDILQDTKIRDFNGEDVVCWECGLYFTGKIWSIPIYTFTETVSNNNYENYQIYHNYPDSLARSEKINIKYDGKYCSICCAVRSVMTSLDYSDQYKKNYLKLLYYDYEKYVGRSVKYIPPAYSKINLKIYKGESGWTDLEFKDHNKKLEKNSIIY